MGDGAGVHSRPFVIPNAVRDLVVGTGQSPQRGRERSLLHEMLRCAQHDTKDGVWMLRVVH